ncbi:glycosyltransferase [Mucilaginibacter sp. RS28]|uniref:Glycosyltransferase n=1 Tax=Mucilaginibacter straminoryzae TaxID=2932774 RepID=A0A9X1X2J8_9SPHI|nr:glycosyltransferase [Mucilaginibacter straminoryzae]MCJ8209964.1 glycosyltransferase [Mucilaginibacter straminoryzae]
MSIPLLQQVLLAVLAFGFVVQLFYLLVYHLKLNSYKAEEAPEKECVPVSVIIAARNERDNLERFLPKILTQNYPDFEVIVVNDCSVDDSNYLLDELQAQYSKLKIVTVTESRQFKTGKKFAITMGIKAAKHPYLLFTDADCEPESENWISCMAASFSNPEHQIVLGYSPYVKTKGLLNALIRFETIKTAINYFSAALKGNAYMGVGRNLAYRKDLFFNNKGFASHMHIMSGDDDLFVNENATRNNVAVEIRTDSFTWSEPKASFGEWFRQKRRHMGAGKFYKARHKRLLGLDAISGLLFYSAFTACLFFKPAFIIALVVFVLRLGLQLLIYSKQFRQLKGKDLLWTLPFLDALYYLYLNFFGLIGSLTTTRRWK